MKRLVTLILAFTMIVSLCACGNNTSTDNNQTTNAGTAGESAEAAEMASISNENRSDAEIISEHEYTSVIGSLSSDAKTLCPYSSGGGGRDYCRLIGFETLTFTTLEGEWQMVIAKEITNPEEKVYNVEIYDYVHDSQNNPVKASDIAFSFDKFIEEGSNSNLTGYLDSYEVTGDYTLTFKFNTNAKGIAQQLFDACSIVTEKAWNDSPDEMVTSPVGTAPYVLSSFESGAYYTFEYDENYWQTDEELLSVKSYHNVDKITLKIYSDRSSDAIALQKGEHDASGGLNYVDYINFCNPDTLEAKEGFVVDTITNGNVYAMTFNCSENSQCSDINLRKAICYCIDENATNELGHGKGQYITSVGYMNPAWIDSCFDEMNDGNYFPYNEDLAKEYLEKSNYDGSPIRILCMANDALRTMAVAVQAYCATIGINVELLEFDSAVYNELSRDTTGKEWDINFGGSSSNYYSWSGFSPFNANTYGGEVCNCQIFDQKLQDLVVRVADADSTSDDILALDDYIEENVYGYALSSYLQPCFTNSRFSNIVRNPKGNFVYGACTITPDK